MTQTYVLCATEDDRFVVYTYNIFKQMEDKLEYIRESDNYDDLYQLSLKILYIPSKMITATIDRHIDLSLFQSPSGSGSSSSSAKR